MLFRPDLLFHASPVHGLRELAPRVSTHGQEWVYATPYIGVVAAYLGKWGDFDFAQRVSNGKPILVERYPGAFKKIYSKKGGSIYAFSKDGFLEGMNPQKRVKKTRRCRVSSFLISDKRFVMYAQCLCKYLSGLKSDGTFAIFHG